MRNTHKFYFTEEFSQNIVGIIYKIFSLNMEILSSVYKWFNLWSCHEKHTQLKLFCLNMSQILCWMSFLLESELALSSII